MMERKLDALEVPMCAVDGIGSEALGVVLLWCASCFS